MEKINSASRDSWNRHKWRRDTSWWDDLEVPTDELKESHEDVFDWLEPLAPDPYEHDYVLYTDGSGCSVGWGGYAAVYEKIDLVDELREPVSTGVLVSGTYGSTVSRSEFNALIDGVTKILSDRCEEVRDQAAADPQYCYKVGTEGVLKQITGPDRIRILWYTDRNNLAQSLLFDQKGDPLMARTKERDLWLRWSFVAPYLCVTPMHRPRNVVAGQALCDALAGAARAAMMAAMPQFSSSAANLYTLEKWTEKKSQTAQF